MTSREFEIVMQRLDRLEKKQDRSTWVLGVLIGALFGASALLGAL